MCSHINSKPFDLLFSFGTALSPETIISGLCKTIASNLEVKLQNKQPVENDFNLVSSLLSTNWSYENATRGTKDNIEDLFLLVLRRFLEENNGNVGFVVSFLVSCCNLPDTKNFYSRELTRCVVNFLESICCDLKSNPTHSVWNEDIDHIVFSLLDKLVEIECTEVFIAVQPKLCDILVHLKGFSSLCNIISRLISNITQIVSRSAQCENMLKMSLMQMFDHFCQLSQTEINKMLHTNVSQDLVEDEEMIRKCISLVQLLFEMWAQSDEPSSKNNILEEVLLHVVSDYRTWCILQMGIYHKISVTRKSTANCLRFAFQFVQSQKLETTVKISKTHTANENDIIFLNTADFPGFTAWQHFISICESLEENQIHVIRPVLFKIPGLFEMKNQSQIPLSWLLAILRRMLLHDSKHVQQEGIDLFLKLNLSVYPVFAASSFFSFIYFGLLPALQDESIYYCSSQDSTESINSVPKMLSDFFKITCKSLPQRGKEAFLKIVMNRLYNSSWSPISLFYVTSAMTDIPPIPCWDHEEMHNIRHLMFHSVRSQSKDLNTTLQKVLFRCFLMHMDVSKITLKNLLNFFTMCVNEQILSRPSKLWTECSKWLKQNFENIQQESNHGNFQQTVSSWFKRIFSLTGDIQDQKSVEESSNQCDFLLLLILMYADGEYSNNDKLPQMEFLLKNIMTQVKAISDKAAMHPYLSQLQIMSAFHFTKSLLTFCLKSEKGDPFTDLIMPSLWQILPGLAAYVMRKLPSSCSTTDRLELYLHPVELFFKMSKKHSNNKNSVFSLGQKMLEALISSSILAVQNMTKNKINESSLNIISVAYKAIAWACRITQNHPVKLQGECVDTLTSFLSSLEEQFQTLASVQHEPSPGANKLKETVDMFWWSLVPFAFDQSLNLHLKKVKGLNFLTLAVNHVDTTSFDNLPNLFTVCKTLLEQVCDNTNSPLTGETETTCSKCIRLLWKTTIDLQNSSVFRPLYKFLVDTIFQKNVLACKSDMVIESVKYVLGQMQAASFNKPLLLGEVVSALTNVCQQIGISITKHSDCDVLKSVSSIKKNTTEPMTMCLHHHIDFLIHCATFSYVPSKSMLLADQALHFTKQLAVDVGPSGTVDKLAEVNLRSSSLLLQLANNDNKFGSTCLQRLIDVEKHSDKKSKTRCHLNSVTHYTKQKLWQNFLLFLPHADADCGNQLVEDVIAALNENVQASIRHFVEWCLTLLLVRYPSCDGILFHYLMDNSVENVSFPAICSSLTVALLLGLARQQHSVKFEPQYFLKLMDITIPWCMTQHFTIRLCAHAVLLRIQKIFEDNGNLDLLNRRFPSLNACLRFADNSSGNVKKNWELIRESPVLFYLDPLRDISLETIFCSLPRLCHVTFPDDSMLDKLVASVSTWMPLRNPGDTLRSLPKPAWLSSKSSKVDRSTTSEHCDDNSAAINLQKKIVVANTLKKRSGLVLVASLIDKPSNLGGLTRTCEVFGADRLVVHSLSCVDDKFYQSLSVTAHKWLRMDEVKRWNLDQYLVTMKSMGYTLIGTEQTEQSQCLSKYKFPEKCVVLLGNEKEGIPPALLRRLDVCLEIPQVGVVRSLNVHVSGAITVWEYAKQLRFTEADATHSSS